MTNQQYKHTNRIYIGNLANKVTTRELKDVFGKYGKITEEPIIRRNFAFIQYDSAKAAQKAIDEEHGKPLCGYKLGS